MTYPPLEPLPLREQAYSRIKQLILDEEFPPNSFLSERGLAERLGMSKTPVRLAIARLEHEGYVRVSPQQGIVVLALSFEEILDYIDFRLALESFVVRSLAAAPSPERALALEAQLAEQAQVVHNPESPLQALVHADMAFHRFLATLLGNRPILQALERQQEVLYRIAMRIFQKYPQRREQSFAEHQTLCRLIAAGQQAEAAALIEQHILRIKSLLVGAEG
ncbi:GntR family transcriptional regulator [Meiothermus hypogaeus]|uniref:GntR family transcriptional regulator n=2 Tax=Meiothermus hypogaeus TaxID=884155 RepID=A0A511QZZ7_9DEIN|nr:GntR family transcriptional regulator [Meiothermus hypogaeus]RIH80847.1 HTH-type transcriptional repressor RspR [Meiothermus hypogaeus]GEM82112.1 GntR family transcriptional regulator [Meiothermus hypogaeus NBRC 106114]GIW37147.1 MAG: GntR family transcriptional regulator [Meiothermus sp.]